MSVWNESESDPVSDIKAATEMIRNQKGYIWPDPFLDVHLEHLRKAIILNEKEKTDE